LNSHESQLPDPRKLRLTHVNSGRARRDRGHSCCGRGHAHALPRFGTRDEDETNLLVCTPHPPPPPCLCHQPGFPEHASLSSPTVGVGGWMLPAAPAKLKLIRLWQLGASQDLFCQWLAPWNSCAGSRRQPRQSRRHQRRPREPRHRIASYLSSVKGLLLH
jgi:hypothetical protein